MSFYGYERLKQARHLMSSLDLHLRFNDMRMAYSGTLMQFKNRVNSGMTDVSFHNNSASMFIGTPPQSGLLASSSFGLASESASAGAKTSSNLLEDITKQFGDVLNFFESDIFKALSNVQQQKQTIQEYSDKNAPQKTRPFEDRNKPHASNPFLKKEEEKEDKAGQPNDNSQNTIDQVRYLNGGQQNNMQKPQTVNEMFLKPFQDEENMGIFHRLNNQEKTLKDEILAARKENDKVLNNLSQFYSDAIIRFKDLKLFADEKALTGLNKYYMANNKSYQGNDGNKGANIAQTDETKTNNPFIVGHLNEKQFFNASLQTN